MNLLTGHTTIAGKPAPARDLRQARVVGTTPMPVGAVERQRVCEGGVTGDGWVG